MHELINTILKETGLIEYLNTGCWQESSKLYVEQADKICINWLKEKAKKIGDNYTPLETHKKVNKILGIQEKSLDEIIEERVKRWNIANITPRQVAIELRIITKAYFKEHQEELK